MNNTKQYGLFDAALIPQVWFNLDVWQLKYVPLYQGNYQPIAEAIPYLIELDPIRASQAVLDLLTKEEYQSGLLMKSSASLEEMITRLAYFYHVKNERNEPFLRRFFDPKFFIGFLQSLSLSYLQFLFKDNLVFYYLTESKDSYHKISLLAEKLIFEQADLDDFIKEKKQ